MAKSHAGGAACGEEKGVAVIQPYKRRRAAPKARPAEKGNLRRNKGGGEKGGAHPRPLPKGWEKAAPEAWPAEKGDGGCDTATYKTGKEGIGGTAAYI